MTILAFDTCFGAVSVAVLPACGAPVVETFEAMTKGHAERLMPMVAQTLRNAGVGYGDLTRIAVTLGPGGFTGLRAGVAAARGLALATGVPVVGVSSLAVMARGAARALGNRLNGATLAIVADARRDEVYIQMFSSDGTTELGVARLATVADAVTLLPASAVVLAGSGAELVRKQSGRLDVTAALPDLLPHAADLAIAAQLLVPLEHVVPNYLRAADAKVQTANVLPRMAP